jgi:hypothetical protein
MAEAIFIDNPSSYFSQSLGNLLVPLTKSIASTHIESTCGSEQAIIRFYNGYGVCIFQSVHSARKSAYEMLVVRFNGLGPNDYELAQYVPVPEINWGSTLEDILSVCKRVSSLPNKVQTPSSHSVSPADQ